MVGDSAASVETTVKLMEDRPASVPMVVESQGPTELQPEKGVALASAGVIAASKRPHPPPATTVLKRRRLRPFCNIAEKRGGGRYVVSGPAWYCFYCGELIDLTVEPGIDLFALRSTETFCGTGSPKTAEGWVPS
ncbi:hypothetical protein HPB50_014164 [Hyalomma asiaticum]|uniref:Uncharacterized protein n=1 Tax=Hyalomma asiaticum TaxID=266040 RepID=A0ACB7THF6_HYAAI|nr:hypothetical protein HPB50_014164 [Hyalomma asiaticum]